MLLPSVMLWHLHARGTEGRQFGKRPLGPDRLFINTVLWGLCVGKVRIEIQQPTSETWAPKARYLWSYLLTYLWDFLQVWRACEDKATALSKWLSSLQSPAPAQGREEAFSRRAEGHQTAPKPWPNPSLFPLHQGKSSAPVHREGMASQQRKVLAARSTPAMRDQRAPGEFVSPLRCRVLCPSRCLHLSNTHAQVSHHLPDGMNLGSKMCGLGFALRLT